MNNSEMIADLARRFELLASEARSMKGAFDDDQEVYDVIESAEDAADDGAHRLRGLL